MTELERLLAAREMTRRDLQQGFIGLQFLMAALVGILAEQARTAEPPKRLRWWMPWRR